MATVTFNEDRGRMIESIDETLDNTWLKNTFLMSDKDFHGNGGYRQWVIKNRYRSTADTKFTSSGIGMNMSCNARPQFTRYADIRSKGKIQTRQDVTLESPNNETAYGGQNFGLGMGGYYSEAFDDKAQRIYMRFGVPAFTPLTAWFSNVFDPKRAAYANRGLLSTLVLGVVDIVSTAAAITTAVTAAPFMAMFVGALTIFNSFTNNSSSRFYSMKPTMHAYWLAVEDILNSLIAKRTLMPTISPEYASKNSSGEIGTPKTVDAEFVTAINKALPDVFDKNGRVSIFGLALRSQSAFNRMWSKDYDLNKTDPVAKNFLDYPLNASGESHASYFTYKDGGDQAASKFKESLEAVGESIVGVTEKVVQGAESTAAWLFAKAQSSLTPPAPEQAVDNTKQDSLKNSVLFDPRYVDAKGEFIQGSDDPADPSSTIDTRMKANVKNNAGFFQKFGNYFMSELTDGAGFAVFSVDSTGASSESFNNSLQANPLEATLNGFSSKARAFTNMAGGAMDIPIVGDMIKLAGDAVSLVASNASWGLANPLLALLYGVNIELPKTWESSSTDFTKADYKIKCIAPYGNAISQLINVYLPMAMVLAGGLPRGTGSQSYNSPFVCQVYDRGHTQITLGMIDRINITRGSSNLPFNRKGQANAVDIEFSVVNLDNVMFTPIATGGLYGTVKALLDPLKEDNTFSDYISSIAGLDVMSQIYGIPKIRLKMATAYLKMGRYINPDAAYFASLTAGTLNSVLLGIGTAAVGKNAAVTGQ